MKSFIIFFIFSVVVSAVTHIPYIATFYGNTIDLSNGLKNAIGKAVTQSIDTIIDFQNGVTTNISPVHAGPRALFNSTIAMTPSFSEYGYIDFGVEGTSNRHIIFFSSSFAQMTPITGTTQVTIGEVFNITGGTGKYLNAYGWITSNTVLDTKTGEYTDFETGNIYVP